MSGREKTIQTPKNSILGNKNCDEAIGFGGLISRLSQVMK